MNPVTLKNRIRKVFARAKDADRLLLVNTNAQDPNFVYMTDFTGGLFEGSIIIISRDGLDLYTSPLEYETAKQQAVKGMKIVNLDSKKKLDLIVDEVKGRVIGINEGFVPYKTYKNIMKRFGPKRIIDASDALLNARNIKDPEEVGRIRKGAEITKKAISQAQKRLREGMTERELAMEFDSIMLKLGSDGPAFKTIVCFGANAALPHHMPDNTRLRKGDFVLIDAGAMVRNYASDVTRTIIFRKGKNYSKKLEILNTVKEAQTLAIRAIKMGADGGDIHMIAQKHIEKAGNGRYKGTFIHSLGHSVGIEVHDGPGRFLSPGSKLLLKEGMVTSVEPGIYIPGFGGARFEDDIAVTKNGAVVL